jgi:hypothetical protein
MKPLELVLLELMLIHVVQGIPHRDALSSYRSPKKSEGHRPQLACQHAHLASSGLGLLLLYVGRTFKFL